MDQIFERHFGGAHPITGLRDMPEASIADLLAGSLAPPPPPVLPARLQQYVDSLPEAQRAEGMKLALASLAGPAPEPAPPPPVPVVDVTPPIVVSTPTPAPTPAPAAPKRKRGRPPQSTTLQIILAGLSGGQTLDTIKAAIELAGETDQ